VEEEYEASRAEQTWNSFYSINSSGANYKMRNYIGTEFQRQFGRHRGPLHLVEVGCGHGSTLLPLVTELSSTTGAGKYHATDVSSVALERLRTAGLPKSFTLTASLWDIVHPPPQALVRANHMCLAIFTLSALHPRDHAAALMNMAAALVEEGGLILFRDYALHDDTQYKRIANKISENFFRRKDGTYAFYFTPAYVKLLAAQCGFVIEEVEVHTVSNENRKTSDVRRRCFIHAVLRIRPAFYSSEERIFSSGRRNDSLFSLVLPASGRPTLADIVRLDGEFTPITSPRAALVRGRVVLRGKEGSKAIVASWVQACEDASFLASVTRLEISHGCKEGLAELLSSRFTYHNVRELSLCDHRTLVPVTSFLRCYASFPSLLSLNLSGNQVDSRGASGLLDLMHGSALKLKSLNLRACSLVALGGNASFLSLVRAALLSGVETLDVSEDHRLDAEGLLELAAILQTAETLQELFLDGTNGVATPQIARAIGGAAASSKSLTGLSLAECRIDDAALASLVQGLRQRAAEGKRWALNLDLNHFTSADPLGPLLYDGDGDGSSARLVSLSISGARLSVESQHRLAGRVACSSCIRQLNISNNSLSSAFLTTLCCRLRLLWGAVGEAGSKMRPASCLSVLNISNNGLGHVGVQRLFSLFLQYSHSQPLRVLRMTNCLPGEGGLAQVKSFFDAQPKFLALEMSRSDLIGISHEKDFVRGLTAAKSFVEIPHRYKIAFLSVLERRKKQSTCFLLPVDVILIIWEFLRVDERQFRAEIV
jgi:Ran GTPase-activating protein (RanGAP) involved in mRNA processing and transport